jgi:oligosaccharide repeat unit polymerase
VSLQTGAFLGEDPLLSRSRPISVNESDLDSLGRRMLRLSLVLSLVVFIGGANYVTMALKRFDLSFSLEGFFSLGSIFYGILVEGEAEPWWFRVIRMWIFPAALLAGFAACIVRSRGQKLLTLIPFVVTLFLGTAIASRYATAVAGMCWASGYLSMKVYLTRGRFQIGPKFVAILLAIACAAVVMYAGLYAVRGHEFQDVSDSSVMLGSDLFGYLFVFDDWVRTGDSHEFTFGRYTMAGAIDLLGIKQREVALAYEHVTLQSGGESNIYTAFRGLVQDFSLPGAFLLCFVAGVFAGNSYTKLCMGDSSRIGVLSGYYAFLLWSPIVSIFNYNGVILALLIGTLTLRLPRNRVAPRSQVIRQNLYPNTV